MLSGVSAANRFIEYSKLNVRSVRMRRNIHRFMGVLFKGCKPHSISLLYQADGRVLVAQHIAKRKRASDLICSTAKYLLTLKQQRGRRAGVGYLGWGWGGGGGGVPGIPEVRVGEGEGARWFLRQLITQSCILYWI